MTTPLVVDRRDELTGEPGLHALIVGVSRYRGLEGQPPSANQFNFRSVAAPALSAARLCRSLLNFSGGQGADLVRRLKTCRLLLDPAAAEKPNEPPIAGLVSTIPTLENFKRAAQEWRDDAADDPGSITLFYFAGHGLERGKEDMIMVMADFGEDELLPSLDRCVSLSNLFGGMGPSKLLPKIARTQFYFIDACRAVPEVLEKYERLDPRIVFPVELGTIDDRSAAIFFAVSDGAVAVSYDGIGTVFGDALREALLCGAEEAVERNPHQVVWPVTTESLRRAIDAIQHKRGIRDKIVVGGLRRDDSALLYLTSPPTVDVTIEVDPADKAQDTTLRIENGAPQMVLNIQPVVPNPYLDRLPAPGSYRMIAVHKGQTMRSPYAHISRRYPFPWIVRLP